MNVMRRRLVPGIVSVLACVPFATVHADEDIPKRQPGPRWEVTVACDSTVALDSESVSADRCGVAASGAAVYVHEHGGASGPPRLTRFDITSGAELWSHDVGATTTVDAYDDVVIVSSKAHFEVYDAETGSLRYRHDGWISEVNRYGTVLIADGSTVSALDPATGNVLWTSPGDLGSYCRDIVVVIPSRSAGAAPFSVVDHRTGAPLWSGDPFDPQRDEVACGYGPYVYTTKGNEVQEWDAFSGWLNWSALVDEAGALEIYREVVLVRSGAASDTVVAVERESGAVLWRRPSPEVGSLVSLVGRLREDGTNVFTLHPTTGDIVNRVAPGSNFDVVASTETRIVVVAGSVVTALGNNDLGTAWQLDVGAVADDVVVSAGFLVVRSGATLRGYA